MDIHEVVALIAHTYAILAAAHVGGAPAIGIIIQSGLQVREATSNDAGKASSYLLNSVVAELQTMVDSSRQLLENAGAFPEVRQKNSAATSRLLTRPACQISPDTNIIIVDRSGVPGASAIPDHRKISYAERKIFKDAVATGRFHPVSILSARLHRSRSSTLVCRSRINSLLLPA